jgi:CBS domain containing-hemolysin-like protein
MGLFDAIMFILCLGAVAFFAGTETSLTSLSLTAWDRLRREKVTLEKTYKLWTRNPGLMMATVIFGNTLFSLGASVLANAAMRNVGFSPRVSVLLASLIGGTLILVLGEIIPKLYARRFQERVISRAAQPLQIFARLFEPAIGRVEAIAEWLTRPVTGRKIEPLMTMKEFSQTLSEGRVEGISASVRSQLRNLVAFHEVRVADVMVPRAQIIAVASQQQTDRMFEAIVRSGFSRIPIYLGNIDNILGIVYAKDLLIEWRSSGLLILDDLLRPPYRIAPDAPLSALMQGFREGNHMAIVTDSYGHTEGLVTIEDVVEAIVGDIADEFDQPQTLL